MKVSLVRICSVLFFASMTFPSQALDEEMPEADVTAPVPDLPALQAPGAVTMLEIDGPDLSTLRALATGRKPDAISLGASLADLRNDEAAWQALAGWVRDGGVVLLHTDAAQLFGYDTVQARAGTPQLAGQLFGRARNALPPLSHPLLWHGIATTSTTTDLPALAGPSRLLPALGVQLVYYQLEDGDALVRGHVAAVPLLRVTDLAAADAEPLYAAAIAPFGNGWAVFTPRYIEQNRADGQTYNQNLLRLIRSARQTTALAEAPLGAAPAPDAAPMPDAAAPVADATAIEPVIGVPASLIESLSDAQNGWAALATQWQAFLQKTPSAFMEAADVVRPETAPRLLLNQSEVQAIGAGLNAAVQGGDATKLRAYAALLRTRLETERLNFEAASEWMENATELGEDSGEVLVWRGIVDAARAQNLLLPSQTRAQGFTQVAQQWAAALEAETLIRLPAGAPGQDNIGGLPRSALQIWVAAAQRAAALMSVEPPLVSVVGDQANALVVRHFPEDPTLRFAVPASSLLARSDVFLGWRMDAEEILIFPNDQYYAAYSTAARAGTNQVAFNPLAQRGNVVGNRILMVSQITLPVLLDPGPPPRYGNLGTAVPAVLGRLHAQVLINALAQDGTPVPAWMQLGLMSLSNLVVVSDFRNEPLPQVLLDSARLGVLLGPQQFENANLGADRSGTIETQARRLMTFFYARFGPGAVVETLQRLGAGQDIDEAIEATTELTEEEFFVAWRDAEFGVR